jgi:hypothetical protein
VEGYEICYVMEQVFVGGWKRNKAGTDVKENKSFHEKEQM